MKIKYTALIISFCISMDISYSIPEGANYSLSSNNYRQKYADIFASRKNLTDDNIVKNQDIKNRTELYNMLSDSNLNNIYWQELNNKLHNLDKVRQLYNNLNYQLLWTDNNKITVLAKQIIDTIGKSTNNALPAKNYHFKVLSQLRVGQVVASPAKFDVVLSDAFITYKSHLENGIIDPKEHFPSWNKPAKLVNNLLLYLNIKSNSNIEDIFTIYNPDYQTLQKEYLKELTNTDDDFIAIPAKKLKFKQTGKAVRVLRKRLGLNSDIDIYDKELKEEVKKYQKNNGLFVDGIAGKETIRVLNIDPQKKLQMLAINMERLRWNYNPYEPYLQVNIPAYKMMIIKNGEKTFESNVIVGRPERPTPIFSDKLKIVVLSPYWYIPETIFVEDKLPLLLEDPNVLGPNIQVIDKITGEIISPDLVDWSDGGKEYILRQKPGKTNALGKMKFLFPNRHAIYLHDTPNRKLFKYTKRAYSSGCVRVERAKDFAVFLLKDMGYNHTRIEEESNADKEKWIELRENKRYPVFLDYYTVWVDNDIIHYSNDIYGYDKKLASLYKMPLSKK